jgi:hypothetical protein
VRGPVGAAITTTLRATEATSRAGTVPANSCVAAGAHPERRAIPRPIAFGAGRYRLFEHRELVGDQWRTVGYSHRVPFSFVDEAGRLVRVQLRALALNNPGRKVEARVAGRGAGGHGCTARLRQ